jgi:hypothetical protein
MKVVRSLTNDEVTAIENIKKNVIVFYYIPILILTEIS